MVRTAETANTAAEAALADRSSYARKLLPLMAVSSGLWEGQVGQGSSLADVAVSLMEAVEEKGESAWNIAVRSQVEL